MRVLLVFIFLFSATSAQALDLGKYKERIRSHMADMLGDDTTNKILGEAPKDLNKIELPQIPTVKVDAKNESFYDKKKTKVHDQGQKFDNMPLEKKRSFRVAYLQQLFEVTRNAEAKKEDIIKYLNVLEQGGSREGVYRSVTLDQVYFALEQYDEAPSDKLVSFVQDYSVRFMAIKYKPESLVKFNLWSLKRIIVDKTLDIMDALAEKPEDLYAWYAVLSNEMAVNYPDAWTSQARKKEYDLYHYKWAQSVPFQHIKSEVIIKLHKLMNYLQQKV